MNDSKRRNRLGNFDQDDIELFLNLVDQNKSLIDSGKQEDKKKVRKSSIYSFLIFLIWWLRFKGWENIEENFNASCTGIKRDIGALKMKLKNLKALNKRNKLDESVVERLEEAAESEQDNETPAKGVSMVNGQWNKFILKLRFCRKQPAKGAKSGRQKRRSSCRSWLRHISTASTRPSPEKPWNCGVKRGTRFWKTSIDQNLRQLSATSTSWR